MLATWKAYNDPNSRPTNNPLELQETVTQDAVPNQQDLSQPDPTPAQNSQDPENTPNASGPVNSHTPDSVSQEEFALVEKLLKCAMIRSSGPIKIFKIFGNHKKTFLIYLFVTYIQSVPCLVVEENSIL